MSVPARAAGEHCYCIAFNTSPVGAWVDDREQCCRCRVVRRPPSAQVMPPPLCPACVAAAGGICAYHRGGR